MSNQQEIKLTEALEALETVKSASYEFPGFWVINLKDGKTYHLGTVNGVYGWNDERGDLSGDTFETTAPAIAKAFSDYLDGLANARA